MEAISQLAQRYFLLKVDLGDHRACIDWAIDRLQNDEDGDDLDVILLAAATKRHEVLPLLARIVERYLGSDASDEQLAAGKYVVSLRDAYQQGRETIASIDEKLTKLYRQLDYPNWLVMLTRNCEYATDVPTFIEPFEAELSYIAGLWESADTRAEFEARYRRAISDSHDIHDGGRS